MANTYTQLAADTFVRANENPLSGGGVWSTTTSGVVGPVQIVSNVVQSDSTSASVYGTAWYTGTSFPTTDQYADITVGACAASSFVAAIVRGTNGVDTSYSVGVLGPLGATATVYLLKRIAGTQTTVAGPATVTTATSDIFRIAVQGTSLTAFHNGSAISGLTAVTDSSIATGIPGLFVIPGGSIETNATISHFDAGSVYAGTVSSVGLSPSTVTYPSNSTGTVTLSANAPTGGIVVTLTSGTTATATVPASVTVLAGASTATFTVTSQNVGVTGTSLITGAIGGGSSSSATITVNPSGGGGGGNTGSLMMTGCGTA